MSDWHDLDVRHKAVVLPIPRGWEFDEITTSRDGLIYDPATACVIFSAAQQDGQTVRLVIRKGQ